MLRTCMWNFKAAGCTVYVLGVYGGREWREAGGTGSFFPVSSEKIVSYEENEKKYTTVSTVFFLIYMYSKIFYPNSRITTKKNWIMVTTIDHDETMSAKNPLLKCFCFTNSKETSAHSFRVIIPISVLEEAHWRAQYSIEECRFFLIFRDFKKVQPAEFEIFYEKLIILNTH